MNTNATPPAQDKGMGCIGKGCLTLLGLIVFLCLAFAAGGYWGVNRYFASEPLPLPIESPTPEPATTPEPPPAMPLTNEPVPPPPTPAPAATPLEQRWKAFEKADEHHENANIILTAGEINGLLSASKNTRGKAFVSIENNVGHVRVSIPLRKVVFLNNRFLNGECSVEASPDGNPMSARISNVVLNGQKVPDSVLDQQLFGLKSIRSYVNEWLQKEQVSSFRIEDNRVFAQKSGGDSF